MLRVRCLLCNEIIESNRNDTANLLEHVKQKHPDIRMTKAQSAEVRLTFHGNKIFSV